MSVWFIDVFIVGSNLRQNWIRFRLVIDSFVLKYIHLVIVHYSVSFNFFDFVLFFFFGFKYRWDIQVQVVFIGIKTFISLDRIEMFVESFSFWYNVINFDDGLNLDCDSDVLVFLLIRFAICIYICLYSGVIAVLKVGVVLFVLARHLLKRLIVFVKAKFILLSLCKAIRFVYDSIDVLKTRTLLILGNAIFFPVYFFVK